MERGRLESDWPTRLRGGEWRGGGGGLRSNTKRLISVISERSVKREHDIVFVI